jgi:hypothetical protein
MPISSRTDAVYHLITLRGGGFVDVANMDHSADVLFFIGLVECW